MVYTSPYKNKFIIKGDTVEIYGSTCRNNKNQDIIIGYASLCDYDLIKDFVWHKHANRYLENKSVGFMHNYILKPTEGLEVDHINYNGCDNRRSNLELVTHSENCFRRRRRTDNTTGVTGVSYNAAVNSWAAYTYIDGKYFNLGYFKNKEDAVYAREYYNKYRVKPDRKEVLERNGNK